ncbi:hypothetical protein GCM10007079_35720 [Nocardiopsis terrae]|uniref:Uncharacterized protein n=1 Tax=Nocardiopsis terrae TaxID=372655 RepID=A0ABR9HD46_9ACTN|nr:hypothetical protein [Nocardiopsis terrae]MBE1456968.1 hypothetical protein [Nocardiopsis terrae]GHC89890.1 hypothetical protein GCM10007079_35720 [Nocardiopsis terrae]
MSIASVASSAALATSENTDWYVSCVKCVVTCLSSVDATLWHSPCNVIGGNPPAARQTQIAASALAQAIGETFTVHSSVCGWGQGQPDVTPRAAMLAHVLGEDSQDSAEVATPVVALIQGRIKDQRPVLELFGGGVWVEMSLNAHSKSFWGARVTDWPSGRIDLGGQSAPVLVPRAHRHQALAGVSLGAHPHPIVVLTQPPSSAE